MDKPLLTVAIVLLWIISLLIYLNFNRYQVHYDRDRGVASVVDKWRGTVQTVPLNEQKFFVQEPRKAFSLKNDGDNNMKAQKQKITPAVIEGIQNKEP